MKITLVITAPSIHTIKSLEPYYYAGPYSSKLDLRYTQKPTDLLIFTNNIRSYLLRPHVILSAGGGRV